MATNTRSLFVKIPRNVKIDISRKIIIQSLYMVIKGDISNIEYISQQFNNFTWRITFKKDYDCAPLFGQKLRIGGYEIEMEDFNEVSKYKFSTYKVMWLPHQFPLDEIEKSFKSFGAVTASVTEETVTEDITGDDSSVKVQFKSGNILVKAKVNREGEGLSIQSGIHHILKQKCFINRLGEKPRCLRCSEVGHIRKNCPLNSIFCSKCGKSGHKAENCSMAKATAPEVENLPDEEDTLDGAENLTESEPTSKVLENLNETNISQQNIVKFVRAMDKDLASIKKRSQDELDQSASEGKHGAKKPFKEETLININDISIESEKSTAATEKDISFDGDASSH